MNVFSKILILPVLSFVFVFSLDAGKQKPCNSKQRKSYVPTSYGSKKRKKSDSQVTENQIIRNYFISVIQNIFAGGGSLDTSQLRSQFMQEISHLNSKKQRRVIKQFTNLMTAFCSGDLSKAEEILGSKILEQYLEIVNSPEIQSIINAQTAAELQQIQQDAQAGNLLAQELLGQLNRLPRLAQEIEAKFADEKQELKSKLEQFKTLFFQKLQQLFMQGFGAINIQDIYLTVVDFFRFIIGNLETILQNSPEEADASLAELLSRLALEEFS